MMPPKLRKSPVIKRILCNGKIKLFVLLVLCTTGCVSSYAQKITFTGEDLQLSYIFSIIKDQTGYSVLFSRTNIRNTKNVSVNVVDMPLRDFLSVVLKDQPLKFVIEGTTVFIQRKTVTSQPPDKNQPAAIVITGRVIDMQFKPMQGVSVTIKGTSNGTATNQEGEFALGGVDPKAMLVFTYVGHNTIQEKINGRTRIIVNLEPANQLLDNAIVYNGYQKIQRQYLTGSVTSLKMDSIIQPGFTTVDKMLEGRVPGLTYMLNSGQAGAAPKLRIRGTSTILGSREPLWVVDGIVRTDPIPIPTERINDPDFVNLLGNAISGLNPHDIDQIDVLKDATAAALYGVRGANGVIVITTKRGKPGPPTVNYNVTGKFTRRPRYSDKEVYMMNSLERVDVSREMIEKRMTLRGGALEAYEKTLVDYANGLIDYDTYKRQIGRAETLNTDWFGIITQDVFATDHSLSISGGNPLTSYRASLGYSNEPGVIKGEYNNRYTGTMNLRLSARKFKAEFIVQLNEGNRRYTPQDLGILSYAYNNSRAIPLYNEDRSLYYYSTISSSAYLNSFDIRTFNVVNEMNRSGETVENNEYTATAYFNYEITNGLQLNTTLSYTAGNSEQRIWFEDKTDWATQIRYPAWDFMTEAFEPSLDLLPFGGELRQQASRKRNYTINSRLDFSRYLDATRKHQLTAALGGEMSSNRYSNISQIRRGYYPNRGHSFADIDLTSYSGYASWLRQNGQGVISEDLQNLVRSFVTSTYVYDNRYVLTATASSDFSNAFGTRSNERFLPTWAISGRWNMHNDILKDVNWVDMTALRLSYGTQGNMLPNQTPYTIISKGGTVGYYGSFYSTIDAFPNPGLAWEKVQDYSASFEFSFLKGKIAGSLGYFNKRTTNAFLNKKVSAINGATSYVVNGGTVENHGVELNFQFRPINNFGIDENKRGFIWRIDPQLGQVFNKLLNNTLRTNNVLVDPSSINYTSFLDGSIPLDGKPVSTFYSYRFQGLDHNYGFPVFYGAEPGKANDLAMEYNKMTKEEMYKAVMIESGRREPVLQGGVTNYFSYRNFSLSFTFTYSLGNKVRLLNIASGNYGTFRPSSQQNLRKEFVNRWRYPGDEQKTNIPGIQGNEQLRQENIAWWSSSTPQMLNYFAADYYQMYDNSDLRVVSGDYVKLQYAALAYNFSKNLCDKLHTKGITLNLSGSNLFTIANKALRGQDPSQSGSSSNINLSIRPVYTFNINVSF
jgi:TonB-linked SusC/RagA family outer membrane protein